MPTKKSRNKMNKNNNKKKDDEIIAGYCDLCREYERNNYNGVLSIMNLKHFNACKNAECIHPVFYIMDHNNKSCMNFPVDLIEDIKINDYNFYLTLDDIDS